MASYDEVITALRNADAAGNADDARALAKIAASMKPITPEKPGVVDQLKSGITTGFKYGGPMGAAIGAIPAASRALDEVAYSAGGKVTDVAASAGLPPSVAAGAGFATNVGMQAIPALVGGIGGKAAAPLMEGGARSLMQSAVKPGIKSLENGKAAIAIQTMLDEGINATKGGVMKLRQKIYELNNEISSGISGSTAVVDKNAVAGPLKEALDRFTKQVNPNADIGKIKAAWDEFLNHPLLTGNTMPVQLAQELKQGTYGVLSKKYGQVGAAEDEAQKAIARGLKEEIAKAVPGVAELNARESRLLTAEKLANYRALMEGNKNPVGLAPLTSHPAAWVAFMADRSGPLKSLLARLMNSGSEAIPEATAATGVAGLRGLLSERK